MAPEPTSTAAPTSTPAPTPAPAPAPGRAAWLRNRGWRDVVLAAFVVQWGSIGVWAVVWPRAFYDSFPGAGRQWIAVDGPFNEHLVRDVGGLFCALAVLAATALVVRGPGVVRAAGLAVATFSLPHVLYHLATVDLLDGVDAVANVGGLFLGLVVAVALAVSPGPERP